MRNIDEPYGGLGSSHHDPHQFVLYIHEKYDEVFRGLAKGLCSTLDSNLFAEDDLMSSFYIQIYERFDTVRKGYEKAKAHYLRGMIRNLFLQVIRSNGRKMDVYDSYKQLSSEECYDGGLEIINQIQASNTINAYNETQQNKVHREIFHLSREGYKHREISELLGIKINTISGVIRREKLKIQSIMNE